MTNGCGKIPIGGLPPTGIEAQLSLSAAEFGPSVIPTSAVALPNATHSPKKEKEMRKLFSTLLAVLCCSAIAYAQSAEKAAAANASTVIISTHSVPPNPNGVTFVSPWITLLSTQIMPPGGKDLFIGFSAQTTLLDISGQGGSATPSSFTFTQELNEIQARVLVDGVTAAPGAVVYDGLIRTLSAALANPITSCHEVAETGVVTCTFGSDFLGQLIETTGVRSFNFIMRDVSPGNHVILAQVRFIASNFRSPNAAPDSSAIAAVVGSRTLTVEQVKLDPR